MVLNVFWCLGNNFGDTLTPKIFDALGVDYTFIEDPSQAQVMCIGSIAAWATDNTIVLGSGISVVDEIVSPHAKWRLVRGPLTYKRVLECGGKCSNVFGDPALLLPSLCPALPKKYDVGIVPHYVDYDYVCEHYPSYKIINVIREDPFEVAREISECRYIISSSLHGIIAAHAYNIPVAWVKFSEKIGGDGIKFHDHYESVGLKAVLSTVENPVFSVATISKEQLNAIKEAIISIR